MLYLQTTRWNHDIKYSPQTGTLRLPSTLKLHTARFYGAKRLSCKQQIAFSSAVTH